MFLQYARFISYNYTPIVMLDYNSLVYGVNHVFNQFATKNPRVLPVVDLVMGGASQNALFVELVTYNFAVLVTNI